MVWTTLDAKYLFTEILKAWRGQRIEADKMKKTRGGYSPYYDRRGSKQFAYPALYVRCTRALTQKSGYHRWVYEP